MEITKLNYFKVVAEVNNITQAAKHLNISQPALSKAIHSLEEELGVKLFNRKGRQIHLNQYGELMKLQVDKAFNALNEGERILKNITGLEQGQVSFAVTFPHVMPTLVQQYLREHPRTKIKQYQATSERATQLILDDKVDFAISTIPIVHKDITWIPLLQDDIYLTVSKQHYLAKRNIVSLQEIRNEGLIGQISGYGFRDIIDTILGNEGITPNYQVEVEDSSAILKLVAMNIGISFTPKQALIHDDNNIVAIPINSPNCYRMIGIGYKTSHYFTAVAESFKQFSIDYFEKYSSV
ncbi:LysR family transcriptional regulator [Staphylococcus croceilyticus]|uniref:LysR family transcriptional regulator n=1 Tax=Staphylococcus croceilyticus TaxID=319942 RepID=UPI0014331F7D|nr:LysR family transcriptional regulator [Staphylococcus croceilyticus]